MKTIKLRIYPNKTQENLIAQHIGATRFIYNRCLAMKIEYYQANKKSLHKYSLMPLLSVWRKDEDTNWLAKVGAQSLQASIFRLEKAYNAFFNKYSKFPKFQSKHKSSQSFDIPQYTQFNHKHKTIKLPKIGWMKYRDHFKLNKIIPKTVTITRESSGKYYACIPYEYSREPVKASKAAIGIDLGMRTYATFSDGTKIDHPNTLKKHLEQLQTLSKTHSEEKTERSRKKLARKHEKIRFIRRDFLHKLTTSIAESQSYDTVVIEDLDVEGMTTKFATINRKLDDSAFGLFREMLTYKLESVGKTLIVIGRFEPSSKACTCGHINHNLTLDDRTWTCLECGTTHDRDILAANNIKRWGTPSSVPV